MDDGCPCGSGIAAVVPPLECHFHRTITEDIFSEVNGPQSDDASRSGCVVGSLEGWVIACPVQTHLMFGFSVERGGYRGIRVQCYQAVADAGTDTVESTGE